MNRILPCLIASLTFVLAGAGTASANAPMKIVAEAGSNVFAQDHEFFDDETFRRSFAGATLGTLAKGSGSFTWKMPACAGGEVRSELIIDAYRFSNSDTATITAHVDLYEGTSCSTTDLDGQSAFKSITLKAGESKTLFVGTYNTSEIGTDYGSGTVTFRAIAA